MILLKHIGETWSTVMIQKVRKIYENKDFLAVDKPAGMLMHMHAGMRAGDDSETLAGWIRMHYPETKKIGDDSSVRPGIVHRLDRETSGVVVIARTQAFFEYFKKLLQRREIVKTYVALVDGEVGKPARIERPIGLKPGTVRRSVSAKNMKMVKEAVTDILPMRSLGAYTLVEVRPKTGRTHQIRVHLASIGCPVVGDVLYGRKKPALSVGRHCLHAASLEFSLPTGERVKIETDLPEDLSAIVDSLSQNLYTQNHI